jgi:hypothetical protein
MTRNLLVTLFAVILLAGCASVPPSDGSAPVASPFVSSPAFETTITLGRAIARVELANWLRKQGVSAANTAEIIGQLKDVADGLIAGQNLVDLINDPARWKGVRTEAQSKLGAVIAGAKIDGVAIADQATADLLAGQLIDTFYQIVKSAARSHK